MFILISALVAYSLSGTARAGTFHEISDFGSNPGNLRMFKYVPDKLPTPHPLVVVLHGCGQSGSIYASESGWTKYAEKSGFALLLPEQQSVNNGNKCFNWFESADVERGSGEALSIKHMIEKMKADHQVDPSQIYITGLSAGGCMTAVMMATYPEDFAGGAIIAGVPYKCGIGVGWGFMCMYMPGMPRDISPSEWGDRVRNATNHTGPWPRVSIWQGSVDGTVVKKNATELMEQWTNVHGIDQIPDVSDTIEGYPHQVFTDDAGNPRVETVTIEGMGHGTPVDPGSEECQCGSVSEYVLDVDICSAYHIAKFWGLDKTSQGSFPLIIRAPADGELVSGTVTVTVTAGEQDSAGVDVARFEFYVDGQCRKSGAASEWDWDTTEEVNGEHVLVAKAISASGNRGISGPISVTVQGGHEQQSRLSETFSDGDENGDLFDEADWQNNGWEAASENHTPMQSDSRSASGLASSGVGGVTGPNTKSLEKKIFLGSSPKLTYFRKLDLRAMVNLATTASFKVLVNGTVVDEESVTWGNYAESNWTERSNIDLSDFANQGVTLTFEVTADSNIYLEVSANALIDDITVSD